MRPVLLALLLVPTVAAQTPSDPPPQADVEDDFWCYHEVQPDLVGGLAALQAAVAYPEDARAEGVEGQVIVQFLVEPDGAITEASVLRSPDERLSAAALDAVRQMTFTPGQQRGRPVAVRFAVPVTFRL